MTCLVCWTAGRNLAMWKQSILIQLPIQTQKKQSGEVIIHTSDTVTSNGNKKVKKEEPIEFKNGVQECVSLKENSSKKLSILQSELDSAKSLIAIQKAEIYQLSCLRAALDTSVCDEIESEHLRKEQKIIE